MSDTLWLILGFLGQLLFSGRFLVQWLASERRGRSVVPLSFWLLSLSGGLTLLLYALHLLDPVFIVGQAGGSLIYVRNLVLVRRERRGEQPRRLRPVTFIRYAAVGLLAALLIIELCGLYFALALPDPAAVANLGNFPANVAARPARKPGDTFRFAVIGDIRRLDQLPKLIAQLRQSELPEKHKDRPAQPIDFLVIPGDATYEALPACHRLFRAAVARLAPPWPVYYIPGDHDIAPDTFPLERWRQSYGPDQFSFTHADSLFVFLHTSSTRRLRDTDACDFLETTLRDRPPAARRVFVFNHVPLPWGIGWNGRDLPEPDRLERIVRQYKVDYFIASDYHSYVDLARDGTRLVVTGGGGSPLADSPFSFYHAVVFTVAPDAVQQRLTVVPTKQSAAESFQRLLVVKMLPVMAEHPAWAVLANALLLLAFVLALIPTFRRPRPAPEEPLPPT